MERQRFLNEGDICELLNAETDSDISDSEFECVSENDDISDFEIENDSEVASISADPLFVAKNQMVWSANPLQQPIGISAQNIISLQPGPTRFATSRCSDILSAFLCFFPPSIERIIIENTNIYGKVKFGDKWTDIDEDTFRAYIAVLILAGVYRGKNEDVHGLFDANFGRPIFRAIMSEGTFHMITSALRFDNVASRRQMRSNDKFAPIREVWERWQALLQTLYNCHENVTIDEQLVGFRGRCSFRQFMPSKPAKYGLKFWLAVDSKSGYVWKIQPYLGKAKNAKPEQNQGQRVVLELTEGLKGQNITADNFFSSFDLVKKLLERKITYVGTVRQNKTFIPPKLLNVKQLPLYKSTFAFCDIATMVSYVSHKNKATILISSMHKTATVDDSGAKKKPEIVSYYNSTKGGVDTADQMIGSYTTKRKTNRWPNIVFANMLDISALNAYILFCEIDASWATADQNRRRPEFLRKLALSLANAHMMKRSRLPQQQFSAKLLTDIQTSSSISASSLKISSSKDGARKRGICGCCKGKSDIKCFTCENFICKTNRKIFCIACTEKN